MPFILLDEAPEVSEFDELMRRKKKAEWLEEIARKEHERIDKEIENYFDRQDANRCRECGHTPETGACFYCRAD
jgi:hypothetical protein